MSRVPDAVLAFGGVNASRSRPEGFAGACSRFAQQRREFGTICWIGFRSGECGGKDVRLAPRRVIASLTRAIL